MFNRGFVASFLLYSRGLRDEVKQMIRRRKLWLSVLFLFSSLLMTEAQTAPAVTGINALQHDGQTFITWTDVATGSVGANYRYDLYRSTAGPITDLSAATLIQKGIYNNSGQLIGPKPYNQTTRQTATLPMSTIISGGSPLPTWSGAAVHTNLAAETAWYAVVTRDLTGASATSPLVVGSNSLSVGVPESPAPILPILQIPGTSPSRLAGCSVCAVTSASKGQPLWVSLHASGGSAPAWGDYWAYWGDSTMGYQEGTQSMFAVYQNPSGGGFFSGFKNQLIFGPQDEVWSVSGNGGTQTLWYGYYDVPPFTPDTAAHVYPFTQPKLSLIVPWVISHYQADPNRIFGFGRSMGGMGLTTWGIKQPNLFAGIFMIAVPIGPWNFIPEIDFGQALGIISVLSGAKNASWVSGDTFGNYLPGFTITINGQSNRVSSVTDATHLLLTNTYTSTSGSQPYSVTPAPLIDKGTPPSVTLPDGITSFDADTDAAAWVAQDCSRNLPYVAWASGRLDMTHSAQMNAWTNATRLANALRACHYGFSFAWNNGNHSTVGDILNQLSKTYIPQLNKAVSYPAFTNFSLDNNYGDGSRTDGDCNSGTPGPTCYVNNGWNWTGISETATSWSAVISNPLVTATATTDITPRNTQFFHPLAGSTVNWTATGGQSGQVVTDSYGLATIIGLTVSPGSNVITMTIAP
jgi:hypothetical protein